MRGWIMLGVLLVWILWIVRIEFGPGLGNIWLRMDASGRRVFNLQGMWAMLIAPWKELAAGRTWLWWPSYWDMNVWVWLGLLGAFFGFQQKRPPADQHIDDKD